MKVLQLSSQSTWRGGEQQIAYLIEELEKAGAEVYAACKTGSAFEAYCRANDIPHFSLPFASQTDFKTALAIRKICRDYSIDVLHAHSSHSHAIGIWSKIAGHPARFVLSRRVDFPIKRNPFTRWKYNFPAIERIVCVSDTIKNIVQRALRRPEKAVTIYSGIDTMKFDSGENAAHRIRKEFNISDEDWLIGNSSALADHKDYFTFLRTARALLDQGVRAHFIIFGEGSLETEIRQFIYSLELQDKVTMAGFRKDINNLLPGLDIFLITSKTEGLGTSVLDAFACKVPVVATEAGGIPEMVFHEETGLLAPVQDHERLANHLQRLTESPELSNTLTHNAQALLNKTFSKEAMGQKTLELYREVIK